MSHASAAIAEVRDLPDTNQTLDVKGVTWFVGLSFALSWAILLPVTVDERGLKAPWAYGLLAASMFGPAIAAFVVARWISPLPALRAQTGLRLRAPGRRVALYWLAAWVGPPLLFALSMALSWALGQMQLDPVHLSGLHEQLLRTPRGAEILERMPLRTIALAGLAVILLAPVGSALATFGEEYGWRGYLLPRLLPLGQWRALVLSGAIWGLWHAPVIALGWNYPLHPRLGILAMTVFCVLMGILLGWLRLESGSVWPPVIAHGAINGSAGGLLIILSRAGGTVDMLHATLLGWSGWLLLGAVIAVLVARGRLPVRLPASRARSEN